MNTSESIQREKTVRPVHLTQQPVERIGDLLRKKPGLGDRELDESLAYHREHGVPLGEAAIALGLASRTDVLEALSQQFRYPLVPAGTIAGTAAIVAATDPFGAEAETFRELRTELLANVFGDDTRRALAIVSPQRGDGRSYVASNLAVTFSQLGRHTLLIDANMRTPAQHRLFGIEQAPGLSSILSGRLETNVVHQTRDLPGLFLLAAGPVPPNPVELLQQDGFHFLVQEMLERFEYVIIDTPATRQGADARVVAAMAGAALIIGRKDQTRIADLEKTVASLANGPAKLAGVVVNDY
ncbi:MAG TPA: polysaccharide biosynthesis tyrosine autokinase [Ramlibacter sp.]|nr:polysaccharide biosynthesis tyrosine autokinase [Ramlibacter sp.]